MSIEKVPPADANGKAATETRDIKKEEEKSGDEAERKEQDSPLEIGEHYLVKRGEDSWRKHQALFTNWRYSHVNYVCVYSQIRLKSFRDVTTKVSSIMNTMSTMKV